MALLLDEKAIPDGKKVQYLLQWLQNLPKVIKDTQKAELKAKQSTLVSQLQAQLQARLGPPLQRSLGRAFVALYEAGQTFSLNTTIGQCCDIIKSKDESQSSSKNKQCALLCLADIYQHHGRMAGTSFPETVQVLSKAMKMQEYRSEILDTFRCLLFGLGFSSSSAHKDIYKCIRNGLGDKSMTVRNAAAMCALELSEHSTTLYSTELDSISNSCLRALDGSSYEVRCSVAKLFGSLLALTQKPLAPNMKGKLKVPSLDEALGILSNGFIKGGSGFLKAGGAELLKSGAASREVRVGVTQTYVVFLTKMGGGWVERQLPVITKHILELVFHSKTISTHIDAVYSRKCVSFILRSVFGRLLGESAQFMAANHLCQFVCQMTNNGSRSQNFKRVASEELLEKSDQAEQTTGGSSEKEKERDRDKDKSSLQQHMLICSVLEIGALIYSLNTAALPLVVSEGPSDKTSPLLSALNNVLLLHQPAARLAGAWCIRCIGLALPSQLSMLLDYCFSRLKASQKSLEAVSGFSYAIAALLGTVMYSELGLPSSKAKEVIKLGEKLIELGMLEQSEKLALTYIQSGWALISAFISLGPVHVKTQIRVLLSTWRSAFPQSVKELNTEQSGGTLSLWLSTLENRAGALTAICSFLQFCSDLLTPELTRRLMLPLDSTLAMLTGLPKLAKTHGVQIKASGAMLRLRLYRALGLLPPDAYEGSLNALLRELVSEFTLTDNLANTTTSLLRSMCHHDDSILLGSWLEETDHKDVEEQLQQNSAAGSGALEHDFSSIFMTENKGTKLPGPLPLGVAVIDAAILLFGKAFPFVAQKHRVQLFTHFRECIRQAKSGRQQAIQINIFTSFLTALKNLVDSKSVLGQQDLLTNAYELIAGALASSEPMLRCAAGEALGRMSQVGGESNFVAQIAQTSFDTLKSTRDAVSRTGHSLVLGCLHRYVGGMGSGQHLQTSVTILHSLTQDTAQPTVQVWALHALVLIADSGGPMFRNYVESTLTLIFHLLVTTPPSHVEVHQCLGKCLSSLITTLGPELQDTSSSMNSTRKVCLSCCDIIQEHPDAIVQSAAIGCLQQLQLFAPQYVSLTTSVPCLYDNLDSGHLLLRRAAANCLRQFAQREPNTIWTLSLKEDQEKGLEHTVLSKLDVETDAKLREDLGEILFSLLTSLAPEDPMKWLLLCNGVLSATGDQPVSNLEGEAMTSTMQDEDEDAAKFTTGESEESRRATKITPRWPTKVFAVECSRKIYMVCKSDPAHFELSLAQKKKTETGGDYLVMHLSELVRTSFIAATASVDQLKLVGYEALRDVIKLFAATPDPDFPGHVLLEQYQAQIGAALRPAFASDTAPHVTAMACQVCSEWLGSGVSRDLGDLKRVQQLLVSSLKKLIKEREEASVYGEAVATMESLAVLKAWAELYIKVFEGTSSTSQKPSGEEFDDTDSQASAMELLDPHLPSLSHYWLAALKDKAYLSLPSQFSSQLPPSGGTFYSIAVMESVKPYYQDNWPSLLHAAAIWLQSIGLKATSKSNDKAMLTQPLSGSVRVPDSRHDNFHLILGLAIQALCVPETLDQPTTLSNCLNAVKRLLDTEFAREMFSSDFQLSIELLSVLHRLLLTCQNQQMHIVVLEIATLIGNSLQQAAKAPVKKNGEDAKVFTLESNLEPGKSCAYALLEVSACCLLRLVPSLQPKETENRLVSQHRTSQQNIPTREHLVIISQALSILTTVVSICAPEACVQILPSVLHMLLSTLLYSSKLHPPPGTPPIVLPTSTGPQSLGQLCALLPLSDTQHSPKLIEILQSALATALGVGKTSDNQSSLVEVEDETHLLVVAVLLLKTATGICPPSSNLFESCVRLFTSSLKSGKIKLQLKALQTCKSLFLKQDPSEMNIHFIHALGPEVVRVVEECTSGCEPSVVVEATNVLDALLDGTPETKKSQMMGLLVPLYVSVLCDPSTYQSSTKQKRQIHDHILKVVTQIGPKYPEAFRSIVQSSPALKQKLESAVRASQTTSKTQAARRVQPQQQQAPSIKLKMDFSNFK